MHKAETSKIGGIGFEDFVKSTEKDITEIKMPSPEYAGGLSYDENIEASKKYLSRHINILPRTSTGISINTPFLVNLYIEGKEIHSGPFSFEVMSNMTLRMLKMKVESEYGIITSVQKWILGSNIANDNELTLFHHGVLPGSHIFLYLMDPIKEKNNQLKTEKQYISKTNDAKHMKNCASNNDFKKCDFDKELCGLEYNKNPFNKFSTISESSQFRELDFNKFKNKAETNHPLSITGKYESKQCKVNASKDTQSLRINCSVKKQANFQKILSPLLHRKTIAEDKGNQSAAEIKDNLNSVALDKKTLSHSSNKTRMKKKERISEVCSLNTESMKFGTSENARAKSPNSNRKDYNGKILNNEMNRSNNIHQTTNSCNSLDSNVFTNNMLKPTNLYSIETPVFAKTMPYSVFLDESEEKTHKQKSMQLKVKSNVTLNSNSFQPISFSKEPLQITSVSNRGENTNIDSITSSESDKKTLDVPEEISRIHNKYDLKGVYCANENRLCDHTDDSTKIMREYDSKKDIALITECKDLKNYELLIALDNQDLIVNSEPFECPICFSSVQEMQGAILRDCLHSFCKACLSSAIIYAEEALVKCPFRNDLYSCDSYLQQREIKSLVSPDLYEQFLQRSIIVAECHAEKSFHCKSPDCLGWCLFEDNANIFHCPVCYHYNCLTCQAIHEGLNCRQYQDQLKQNAKLDKDAEKTLEFLDKMVEDGKAMKCPKCCVILMKKWGCDWLKCSVCQTEICWITKGPRWGPEGRGDTSAGCKCGVNGIRCHPSCTYCH